MPCPFSRGRSYCSSLYISPPFSTQYGIALEDQGTRKPRDKMSCISCNRPLKPPASQAQAQPSLPLLPSASDASRVPYVPRQSSAAPRPPLSPRAGDDMAEAPRLSRQAGGSFSARPSESRRRSSVGVRGGRGNWAHGDWVEGILGFFYRPAAATTVARSPHPAFSTHPGPERQAPLH